MTYSTCIRIFTLCIFAGFYTGWVGGDGGSLLGRALPQRMHEYETIQDVVRMCSVVPRRAR